MHGEGGVMAVGGFGQAGVKGGEAEAVSWFSCAIALCIQGLAWQNKRKISIGNIGLDKESYSLAGRERERDLLQVPHFFVGTLQPL